ncbi:hypothetical protein MIMGU_mgv1a014303mg [Erythranthe guttata]|uniref:Uncharacterized protein n=1 Tax=Erythranthe guttata TaxID=4155 RepID=A0A022RPT9_ERYGU|nr:hypothetical protein MIMGU_mgv1a014303mg [Erythranthe guttata]
MTNLTPKHRQTCRQLRKLVVAASNSSSDNSSPNFFLREAVQFYTADVWQLESVEEDKNVSEESTEEGTVEDRICSEIDEKRKEEVDSSDEEEEEEEIMKELKNIKRQNSITHCLLTTLIVLTLAWQFSEVSLILKIKNGLSNPFKAVGGIVKGLWQTRSGMMKRASDLQKQVTEQASLKIPQLELPGVDEHNQN